MTVNRNLEEVCKNAIKLETYRNITVVIVLYYSILQ